MRTFTIHKPTHTFHNVKGTMIAIGQRRGDTMVLNRLDDAGVVIEKAWVVGSCFYAMTGFGDGVAADNVNYVANMNGAWLFAFGPDIPAPASCVKIGD